VRVTSVTGETVEDALPSLKGGVGTAQFTQYDRPAALPALATVWPGYGKPWAERVFKGVAATGPAMPRPAAKAPGAAKVEQALQPNAARQAKEEGDAATVAVVAEEVVGEETAAVSTQAAADAATAKVAETAKQPAAKPTVVKAVSKMTVT
jgi:hypothetical protein